MGTTSYSTTTPQTCTATTFDNVIDSVKQTGMWIYYENYDYNVSPGYSYFVHGIDISVNFPPQYCDLTSSLRFVGSMEVLNADTITFYEGTSFTAREYYTEVDTADFGQMAGTISSLIVTGLSPWTVYSGPNFSGLSFCVYADTDHDVGSNGEVFDLGIYPNMDSLNSPDNSIYSVRKGCWAGRKVKAPELKVDGRQKNGAWGRLV